MRIRAVAAALAAVFCMAAAADPAERLPDPGQEARARHIFEQVRCLVCQNESIDDSEAELAGDLRRIVRQQVREGRSDDQIKRFLVDRYGEFVLMRPAFSPGNAALWLGPFLVVAVGAGLLLGRLRKRAPEATELDAADAERLRRLTDGPP
jgi:cytochrome c-type biogenesis protein CcmH